MDGCKKGKEEGKKKETRVRKAIFRSVNANLVIYKWAYAKFTLQRKLDRLIV